MKKLMKWSLSENQAFTRIYGESECATNGLVLCVNLGVIVFLGVAFGLGAVIESVM